MKIALVTREFPPSKRLGGISFYVRDLARMLANQGHEIFIVAASDDFTIKQEYEEHNYTVIKLAGADYYVHEDGVWGRLKNKYREFAYYTSYRKKLSEFIGFLVESKKIDIIEFPEYGSEYLFWIKNRTIPTVIRLHGPSLLDRNSGGVVKKIIGRHRRWKELRLLKYADAISSPSHAMLKWTENNTDLPKFTKVINNSINLNDWTFNFFDIDVPKKRIVFAGTVSKSKGVLDLYKAVSELNKYGEEIELILAGRLGDAGRLLRKIKTNEQKKWLKIPGMLPRNKLAELYKSATVCVFPSWWEPFGLVCVEAMATGSMVIGSSSGGMSEIIKNGENGFLVDPHSPEQIINTIKRILLLSENENREIRKNARFTAEQEFNSSTVSCETINFYRSVITNNAERNERCL